MEGLYEYFKIDEKLLRASEKALEKCSGIFGEIEKVAEYNQQKVLSAFIKNHISETSFAPTSGYGYGDRGRELTDAVFASALGAESALVRSNFTCGTQTLSVMLFGILRPGDKMLCVTGTPYDTIHGVIGIGSEAPSGSLKDFGVKYDEVPLLDNDFDYTAIKEKLTPDVKMVYVQRSCGYAERKSISVSQIAALSEFVKGINSNVVIAVDNCYGEFVEKKEPTQCGADIMAGSLIKNPGGGIARSGGYIAGRKDLVELCAGRLTTPNLGSEVGSSQTGYRELLMGIFYAPHTVCEALKSAVFASSLFAGFGYAVSPAFDEERHDIVETIYLENEKSLVDFCCGIQSGSPVDSFVTPEPWDMPGYDCKVVMASGSFTEGSSIELSADAPIREPYCVYLQGGLDFNASKVSVLLAAQKMLSDGMLKNQGAENG